MRSYPPVRRLLDGLAFPEGPRWREDRLWLTDQHAHEVITVDMRGNAERIVQRMEDRPGGLGFLPDGTPLVVAMTTRRVLRIRGSELEPYVDLAHLASFHCNDMLVDRRGRAYVGNFGYDVDAGAPVKPAELILVGTDRNVKVVNREVIFPNGTALTPDGKTLMVAETFAARISAFDVAADGTLENRRIWAEIDGLQPDGLCLDEEGAVWCACTKQGRVFRLAPSGEPVAFAEPSVTPYACMLGGPERRHLFALCAETSVPAEAARRRTGRIEIFEVDVPGAGLP